MRKVLEKAEFKVLALVGDVYQIESRAGSASKGNTISGKSVAGCYCISGVSI